jgi:hypothetical protein
MKTFRRVKVVTVPIVERQNNRRAPTRHTSALEELLHADDVVSTSQKTEVSSKLFGGDRDGIEAFIADPVIQQYRHVARSRSSSPGVPNWRKTMDVAPQGSRLDQRAHVCIQLLMSAG